MTIRLTRKRRLPEDTKGERVLTPFGEIHTEARTLALWQKWEPTGLVSPNAVEQICAALLFDIAAGFISPGLTDEINKRLGRTVRGKPARKH